MAYDSYLQERIDRVLIEKKINFSSKKMMGGLCYMLNDKMLMGIVKEQVMARIGPSAYPEAINKSGVHEMNFTGRSMKGYVFLDLEAVDLDEDLEYWIQLCLDFNPEAKSSKKKTKS